MGSEKDGSNSTKRETETRGKKIETGKKNKIKYLNSKNGIVKK